ncbi:MAG TPA: ABC transporter substrate-binding protein, partial [Gemmatimonadaceae bacterium]|nr:ABC transporter substrate-binding protein [Gemmatimonadaceae bacterium]
MSDVTAPSAARAEQFVRAQLHETLVRLDCEGRVVAGLAGSWTIANDQLTLRLRNDARFWNGEPVTTRDVVAAWQVLANAPVDDAHRSLARRLLASATLVDDHTLRLTMTVGDSLPRALAEGSLAIFRQRANDWPLGTGSYRPAENSRTLSQSIRLDPVGPGAVPRLVVNGGIGA